MSMLIQAGTLITLLDNDPVRHNQGILVENGMIQAVDDGVGKLFGALEATGQLDETVLILTSDHGYWYGEKDGWERLNINMITYNEPLCPVTAGPPLKELLCRVEKQGS